jgi:hypothetical protein
MNAAITTTTGNAIPVSGSDIPMNRKKRFTKPGSAVPIANPRPASSTKWKLSRLLRRTYINEPHSALSQRNNPTLSDSAIPKSIEYGRDTKNIAPNTMQK